MKLTSNRLIEIIKEELSTIKAAPIAQTTGDIISTLETLYNSLTEDLEAIEDELLEGDGVPDKVMQWLWWAPRAKKAQAKVNKVKMNITALEFAESQSEGDKKSKLGDKVKLAKDQAKELQSMVDDKFEAKGDIVKGAIQKVKIEGQLAVIKRTSGMTDNPEKSKELKDQMKELNARYAREEAALKELEPSDEDKKSAKDEIDAKAKSKVKDPVVEEPAADSNDDDSTEEEPAVEEEPEEIKSVEKTPKKNNKEGKLERLAALLKSAEEAGIPDKIKKVKALIDRVSAKENWQLDGTTLGSLLESEITALEGLFTLNESKYSNLSIKDKFSKLL